MKKIKLTQGKYAVVDNEDFEYLNQFHWYYFRVVLRLGKKHYGGYAARYVPKNGKSVSLLMHREIIGVKNNQQVDHINHNQLDNRKVNLRIVSASVNQHNRKGLQINNTSGYTGVCHQYGNPKNKPWIASIKINNKSVHLGYFVTKREAAVRYGEELKKLFPLERK